MCARTSRSRAQVSRWKTLRSSCFVAVRAALARLVRRRFETVKAQMDDLVGNVEKTTKTLEKRGMDFQAMYDGVRAEHASLSAHVVALEAFLVQVDSDLAHAPDTARRNACTG